MRKIKALCYGYPKIGNNREVKKLVEGYWDKKISKKDFLISIESFKKERLKHLNKYDIDYIAFGDFSLYDFMLDISLMFNVIPSRFSHIKNTLDLYFAMARGRQDAKACEMLKWFDTNYHYIVPEISNSLFSIRDNFLIKDFIDAKSILQSKASANIVGPFTYLKLSNLYTKYSFEDTLVNLCESYNKILVETSNEGSKNIFIDEPFFVLDLSSKDIDLILKAYEILTKGLKSSVYVKTYYESLSEYKNILFNLSVDGVSLDFDIDNQNLKNLEKFNFPKDKELIAGIVSGRNPWKIDYQKSIKLINTIFDVTNKSEIIISNSSPLFHMPISLEPERGKIKDSILNLLSFADEKLQELVTIKEIINNNKDIENRKSDNSFQKFYVQDVKNRFLSIDDSNIGRKENFKTRYKLQSKHLNIPMFPTTTIGSFPQTKDIRKARANYNKGIMTKDEYSNFIKENIKNIIKLQEDIGLDVLVHGEFERSDMVEFFAKKLKGIITTTNGWVQSYGTRCIRVPIIYGDVYRDYAMSIKEVIYAQSLTKKYVKAILTGAVSILNWSFYRKDIEKKEIAYQIALSLKDEIKDLQDAGIKIIQVDEPAFREGMPLKRKKQKEYIEWAINSFKLTTEDIRPENQLHTHMCYCDFGDFIESIYKMDADVISIEASRSKASILDAFVEFNYDLGIGIGVWDIHSPRVPTIEEIKEIIEKSTKLINKDLFWINPDCGLKTRGYQETIASLKNMVQSAKELRA